MANFTDLGGCFYLVRTQAGLNSALKDYMPEYKQNGVKVEGAPTSYPSVIHLANLFVGYHLIQVNAIHFNKMKDAMDKSDAEHLAELKL